MLHRLVDKVFLITTIQSKRFEYISSHLKEKEIDYQIIIAPNYETISDTIKVLHSGKDSRSSISLLSTYQSIVETAKLSNYKKISIIEDDCYFVKDWKSMFMRFYDGLPNDWDLINLGYHPIHDTDSIKESFNKYSYIPKNWHHTTHCMMINHTVFDEFLNLYSKWKYTIPIDYTFNEIYKNSNYKSFCPIEKIVYQLSVRDIVYPIEDVDLRFESAINL